MIKKFLIKTKISFFKLTFVLAKLIIKIYQFLKFDLFFSYLFFTISTIQVIIKIHKKKKDFKTVLLAEGGFGHSIIDVEIAKLALNKNFVVLILSEHKRHNWELKNIWKDIKVFHIFKTAPFFSSSTQSIMQIFCTKWIYKIHSFLNREVIEANINQYNIEDLKTNKGVINLLIKKARKYKDYKFKMKKDISLLFNGYKNYYEGHYAYLFLRRKLKQNNILINESFKKQFKNKISSFNIYNKEVINIYLRQKGNDVRCGSTVKEWTKVIRFLIKKDFFILLTGDTPIDRFPIDIRENIYSHNNMKISKNIFSLCAPYFSDYCISEQGGGQFLGMVMNKPLLLVNCWQIWGCGGTDFYILFKNLINTKTKKVIKLENIFKTFFWSSDVPINHKLKCNTSKQLIEAFSEFHELVNNQSKDLLLFENLDNEMKYSWGAVSKSKLISSNNF